MTNSFLSRERAAGYDPAVLNEAVVLVVGLGALGQNVLMNLALSQVGTILLVDLDQWETHNATRSPFFPARNERVQWGPFKSKVAAYKARQLTSWSNLPRLFWATQPIEALGDAPFRFAHAIVSAVDRNSARSYLGRKAAQFRLPLVEGGFHGARTNAAILRNDTEKSPCWNCNLYDNDDRNKAIQLGCTAAANVAVEAGFTPAIQSAAACLAALMSEATIQLLHGRTPLDNRQVFMDVRAASSVVNRLGFNPRCRDHGSPSQPDFSLNVSPEATCAELLSALGKHATDPIVHLPFGYVVRVGCAQCKRPISIHRPEWIIADLLFCKKCGGLWSRTDEPGNEIYPTLSHDTEPLLPLKIGQIGLVQGSLIDVELDGQKIAFELGSLSLLPFFTQV